MNLFVALIGALFLAISLAILVSPRSGRWSLENLITRGMMPVFSIVRIGFGIVFVLAAPSTRLPGFVWALGLLLILSGDLSADPRIRSSEEVDGLVARKAGQSVSWLVAARGPARRAAGVGRELAHRLYL